MKRFQTLALSTVMAVGGATAWTTAALAQEAHETWGLYEDVAGKPVPGGVDFQRPVTPVMHDLVWFDTFMHLIMLSILGLVIVLIAIVVFRFNRRANPTPATFTHHALLEVVWTALPVIILIVIAIPSLKLLFEELNVPTPDLTIKATGNQWYWTYDYPDQDISFASVLVEKDELAKYGYTPDEYLLGADNRVIVPVNKVVHVLVTGADVIHSWAVPSFGVKIDAMPGRLNETWFKATEPGVYFGQCSELCGIRHAYMPIVVEAVEQSDFDAWVKEQQAMNDTGPAAKTQVAAGTSPAAAAAASAGQGTPAAASAEAAPAAPQASPTRLAEAAD